MKNVTPKIVKAWFYHLAKKEIYIVTIASTTTADDGKILYEIMFNDNTGQGYVKYVTKKSLIFME